MGTFIAPVRFFQTWWFLAPGILLMLNIISCSINRWKSLKAILQGGKIKQPESFFTAAGHKAGIIDSQLSPVAVSPLLENTLKRQGYRVRSEGVADGVCLAADKNRYFRLGTYLSHLSLIIFVLAYLIGSVFGFRDPNFITNYWVCSNPLDLLRQLHFHWPACLLMTGRKTDARNSLSKDSVCSL